MSFQCEDKKLAQNMLQAVGELIKDSDAAEEKEMVKNFLQKISEAMTFVVVGDAGSGKSTFLDEFFDGVVCGNGAPQPTMGICEIKGGAQDAELKVNPFYVRRFVADSKMEGISVIDTQGLDTLKDQECAEVIRRFIKKSDVLFVVFDALHIRSFSVWDFLEEIDRGKMIFVMTGCDKADQQTLAGNRIKLQQYMAESDITAPIFMYSSRGCDGIEPEWNIAALKTYVQKNVLGETPTLTKQRQNLAHLEEMLGSLSQSFDLRKRQLESDQVILENINRTVDNFLKRNRSVVDRLKGELRNIISQEIEAYQAEIIKKMDPLKIKERCPGGPTEVEAYLGAVNENYRNLMNTEISQTTQEAVRRYCAGLQDVFEEATGFFRKRQNLLDAEDKFYGSLEQSKKEMLYETDTMMVDLSQFYERLANASEELFMGVWKARGDYDAALAKKGIKGAIKGGGVGAGLGAIGAVVSYIAAESVVLAVAWPVVGVILGAVIISKLAKKMSKASAQKDMWAVYEECVAEFKQEVSQIKEEMTEQVLQTVTEIFDREVRSMDNTFKDFRMAVNIDSRNVPLLEAKLETVQNFMEQIAQLKRDREMQAETALLGQSAKEEGKRNVMEYEAGPGYRIS